MFRKILFFLLGSIWLIPEIVSAKADFFTLEYYEDPDIYVYSPVSVEEDAVYPVLYLIHGRWQQPTVWEKIGLLDTLNHLYDTGEIIPFFVVLPHDVAYMEDIYESKFHDEFLLKVMPFVEENFPVDTAPDNTAVGGISRGAQWAQYFAFENYGRFGSVGVHSPANAFYSLPKIYGIIRDHPDIPALRVRIDIGNQDNAIRIGSEFSEQLLKLFYPHELVIGDGGHDLDYWKKYLPDYLKWYSDGFRIKQQI